MQPPSDQKKAIAKKDVYFIHNHVDKESVQFLAEKLADEHNIKIWLDEWDLVAGEHFVTNMYKGLKATKTCAVFISDKTPKGWVNEEINQALVHHNKNGRYRIIPVLLPNAKLSNVRNFLDSRTFVQFKNDLNDVDALHQLISGIRGEAPGRIKKAVKELPVVADVPGIKVTFEIKITLDHDFETFDDEKKQQCLDAIAKFIGSQPKLKNISKGSVILNLEMSAEEVKKLLKAIKSGGLKAWNVSGVSTVGANKEGQDLLSGDDKGLAKMAVIAEAVLAEHQAPLSQTFAEQLAQATKLVARCLQSNRNVLFVSSHAGLRPIITQVASQVHMPTITIRWRKGLLIKESTRAGIAKKTGKPGYKPLLAKKSGSKRLKFVLSEKRKFVRRLAGDQVFLPGAIVLVYPSLEPLALIEANQVKVPVIGIGTDMQKLDGKVQYPIIIKHPNNEIIEKILLHLIQSPSYVRRNKKDKPKFD